MKVVDRAAPEPVEVFIDRSGRAVATAALRLMGGGYGKRVVVVAGKGNNGADGRAAGIVLSARGVRVMVLDARAVAGTRLPDADLVIDAAYGTGFRGTYLPPDPGAAPVLAVDIPSGLSGATGLPGRDEGTGAGSGGAVRAVMTVTFQAYKPGVLLGEGPERCGLIEVADIGLGPGVDEVATAWLVEDTDVAWLPGRPRNGHKWQNALLVVAGAPGMLGAASLVARAAMRAGSGYVRLGVPGLAIESMPASEAVGVELPARGWDQAAAEAADRCRAVVTGPGLGRSDSVTAAVTALLEAVDLPVVVDADGLNALASLESTDALRGVLAGRTGATVLTPHDGEYTRLIGRPPGDERLVAVREAAARCGAVVLLKGPTTIVAAPDGRAYFVTSGSARLATAGTGDVLSGMIGALLARGVPALEAAALGAHVHGRAARAGRAVGLVAGDLPDLVADWLSAVSA